MPRHPSELGPFIEATNLDPNATHQEIRALANEAIRFQVAAVCVLPYWLPLVVDLLKPHHIPVATVVSYLHGLDSLNGKLRLMDLAEEDGADEVNVTLNPQYINNRDWQRVEREVTTLFGRVLKMRLKVVANVSRLAPPSLATLAQCACQAEVDYLALCGDGSNPSRDDVAAAHWVLSGSQTQLLTMGYTQNLPALRAVNAGARRVSTQFVARLVGP